MERGQITRYESGKYCSSKRCNNSVSTIRAKRRRTIRLRKKMIKVLWGILVVAFFIFMVTAIVTTIVNVKMYVEKMKENTEIYNYQFSVEERKDDFSTQYKNNAEKMSFEIEEVRAPIALAEATPREEVRICFTENASQNSNVIILNEFENEEDNSIEIFEGIEEELAAESITAIVENVGEYKPTKLTGYEISATGPYEHYVYILSEEDMNVIAKLVWMEARGESYEGMVAVAAVVLNRYFSDDLSFNRETILHTVTQKYQFASIWGVTDWDLNNVPDCLKAVEDACRGWDPTRAVFEEGALFFYAPSGVSGYQAEIRQNIKVMVIGNHNFHFDFEKLNG